MGAKKKREHKQKEVDQLIGSTPFAAVAATLAYLVMGFMLVCQLIICSFLYRFNRMQVISVGTENRGNRV
jgi:hypothetical protein